MSVTKDNALVVLDSIIHNLNNLGSVQNDKEDLSIIEAIAFINYKGLDGRIVWDYAAKNELTFIENTTGKYISLGESINDGKTEEVFFNLAKEYTKDDNRLVSEIVISYDSKKAKDVAKKLCDYLRLKKNLSVVFMESKEYHHLIKHKQITVDKEIIIGHDSWTRNKIANLGENKTNKGISIGYDNHTCVLMVERTDYPYGILGEKGKYEFGVDYVNDIREFDSFAKEIEIPIIFDKNKKTTESMYDFLIIVFGGKGYLDDFLEMENIECSLDIEEALCVELQNNPICKKYINSDILEKICERKNFFSHKGKKKKSGWKDLYTLDDSWHIQRYWIKNYCRIINYDKSYKVYGTIEQIIYPILEHCRREELKEKIRQREWGIVFCGGGGKGAYQIGVWKWLIEQGMADKITGVSGVSVGALNSLLFVEGNYELARKIWRSVTPEVIMEQDGFFFGQDQKKLKKILDTYMGEMKNIETPTKLVYSTLTGIKAIPLKAVYMYKKKGVAPRKSKIKEEYICWESRKKEEIQEIVLASSAIPIIKKSRNFQGREFVDGGLADNVPVRPLIEDGFQNIIIINLDEDNKKNEKAFKKATKDLVLDDSVHFYPVVPSEDLGKMLNSGAALTKDRMDLGYQDAAEQLAKILSK